MTKLKKKKTKIHIASQGLLKKIMNFNQVVEIAFPGCSENDGIPPSLNSTKLGKHQPHELYQGQVLGSALGQGHPGCVQDWRAAVASPDGWMAS